MSCNFTSPVTYCDGLMGPSLATVCNASKFFTFMSFLDALVHRLIKGINMTLKLMNTMALLAHDFTLSITPLETCSSFTFSSDQYWACSVRHITYAGYHLSGSCKMGPSSDPMAVVDHRLRVHGIKGLRVADASIMPQITSSNTAAPTMMIGERAADFIRKDLNSKC